MKTSDELTLKGKQNQQSYYSSFEDKYVIFDNLDIKSQPFIEDKGEIHNNLYVT